MVQLALARAEYANLIQEMSQTGEDSIFGGSHAVLYFLAFRIGPTEEQYSVVMYKPTTIDYYYSMLIFSCVPAVWWLTAVSVGMNAVIN